MNTIDDETNTRAMSHSQSHSIYFRPQIDTINYIICMPRWNNLLNVNYHMPLVLPPHVIFHNCFTRSIFHNLRYHSYYPRSTPLICLYILYIASSDKFKVWSQPQKSCFNGFWIEILSNIFPSLDFSRNFKIVNLSSISAL
jgi:hypothetical protein